MKIEEQPYTELKLKVELLEKENALLKQKQGDHIQSKELYLKIHENSPAMIWRAGNDKLCNYFNKTWLDFTGRTLEEEKGLGWTKWIHPDDYNKCLQIYADAFEKRKPFIVEYRLKNRSNTYRWITCKGRPFFDLDNTFLGYVGSCNDITINKENEIKLKELNATKDKFFAIIAHDLRNPFHNIIAYTDLLSKGCMEMDIEEISEITEQICLAAETACDLLENLLLWANSCSDKIPFKPVKLNVSEQFVEIVELLRPLAASKNIKISHSSSPDLFVFADENMLSTVVRNLLSNAIKFSFPDTKISLKAEIIKDNIRISIIDSGMGMDEKTMSKLFKLGENASKRGTANETGSGLGLILCKEFVERNNGEIWVESQVNKGSKFMFTIPVKET